MSLSFRHVSLPSGVQLKVLRRRLLGTQVVETSLWPHLTGKEGAAARYLLALADSGEADISATEVLVVHPAIAALPASVAEAVRLPPLGTLSVTLAFQGIMTDPRARIRVSWYDADTRRIRIERTGALARWGALEGRLSGPLYALTEAIDRYNATESSGSDIRIAAWAPVQNALKMTHRTGGKYRRSLSYQPHDLSSRGGCAGCLRDPLWARFPPRCHGSREIGNP